MNHVKIGALSGCWLLCSTLLLGCITDTVPPDIYSTGQSYEPAVADGPGSDMDRPDMPENPDSPDSPDPLEPPVSDMPARDASIGSDPPSEGCDLSGEWLVTERNVASGLGVKQAGVTWFYYEIEQSGNQLQVKRGLVCGSQVKPVDAVSAAVNYSAAWPKMLQHNRHDGRRGTINPTSSGCSVSIERAAIVISATMPYYADSSRSLPTTEAAGATPGWEDWDNDGHPAVSMRVSGLANGDRYCTTRTSAIWQGEAATDADYLKLRSDWRQDESVLGVTSDILKATGARDGDSSLHFVEFAKLSVGQVSGDDTTICKKIRELAPTLTPAATK